MTKKVSENEAETNEPLRLDRRLFLAGLSGVGLSVAGLAFGQAETGTPEIGDGDLTAAARLAGLDFTETERKLMLGGVRELRESYEALRQVPLPNSVAPALRFDPLLGAQPRLPAVPSSTPATAPAKDGKAAVEDEPVDLDDPEQIAFLAVSRLSDLVRRQEISSEKLTQLYLERLKRTGPRLECVITLTEERALKQARAADREIAAGRWRGPLHGIPWGAKDLLAVRGYPTTWGATPFKTQVLDEDAAVVRRLDQAGAVLVAKLTLGALAWGDVWFGGQTRNPWNLEQGSSGSSAGSASATAAGLVGFSLGSETWGSIVSPSTRCGTTGLRPTFGRVSREGALALSWSMDKLGPICRSVEDCALVFAAICGEDAATGTTAAGDAALVDLPFTWEPAASLSGLRVGYVPELFEPPASPPPPEEETSEQAAAREEWRQFDLRTLDSLRQLGLTLQPIRLPDLPVEHLSFILSAEAAAAFDELTRSGRDDELVRQVEQAWPNVFRQARTIPAVEYIQANRVRTLLIRQMEAALEGVDVYVTPSFGGDHLLLTNLTGHPCVVLPNGFRQDGTPTSITFMGRLFGEEQLLLLARAYQRATDFHLRRPTLPEA